jgi:hypothetical protein
MADVTVRCEGTVVAFTLHTDEVREWFEFNVASEPWQWLGNHVIAVDRRFAPDMVDNLRFDGGFTVSNTET